MQGKENDINKKQLVSPIIIKNNIIIKAFNSYDDPILNCPPDKSTQKNFSNLKNHNVNAVKMNLNVHFTNDNSNNYDSDHEFSINDNLEILNYSIVKDSNEHEMTTADNCSSSIKIKLRKSSKNKNYYDTLNNENDKNKSNNIFKNFDQKCIENLYISEEHKIKNTKHKLKLSENTIFKSSKNEQENDDSKNTKEHDINLPKINNNNYNDDDRTDQNLHNIFKNNPIFNLPCRENEYKSIYNYLKDKIQNKIGGCIYISGVPGTGKTETVISVIKHLKNESKQNQLSEFDFIEINGMKLTEPRQAYVQIYKQLYKYDESITINWKNAFMILENRYTSNYRNNDNNVENNITVLLVDELDVLCNRRQDVIYNLLDWPTKYHSNLIVITIANTMDLPERILKVKITSRLGLTRLTFSPYTYHQLQKIIIFKLNKSELLHNDAIEFLARKIAAVSGDARRALNICKRVMEIYENDKSIDKTEDIQMHHVQQAISEMISNTNIQAIQNCSFLEKILLQAIVAEMMSTSVEETIFYKVYLQMKSILSFMGIKTPCTGNVLKICSKLNAERLLLCEHSRMDIHGKILLNVNIDDVYYATKIELPENKIK